MSEHDELCPVFKYPGQICECYFIGKARADEDEKIARAQEREAAKYVRGDEGDREWAAALRFAAGLARNGGRDG